MIVIEFYEFLLLLQINTQEKLHEIRPNNMKQKGPDESCMHFIHSFKICTNAIIFCSNCAVLFMGL